MTGKSREGADTMERRKTDLACVQETKWKGAKAREITGGFKLFYNGGNNKRNGVGIIVKKEWQDNIMEIKRTSDRLMSMKLVKQNGKINIVSAYAPQVGCSLDEKEAFWEELEDLIRGLPEDEQVIIGADLNGYIGKENEGYEQWHGGYNYAARNVEGEEILEFSQAYDMAIANTFFKQRDEHYISNKSGPNKTVIDYMGKAHKNCIIGQLFCLHHITGTASIIRLKLYVYIVENSETFKIIYSFMQFK